MKTWKAEAHRGFTVVKGICIPQSVGGHVCSVGASYKQLECGCTCPGRCSRAHTHTCACFRRCESTCPTLPCLCGAVCNELVYDLNAARQQHKWRARLYANTRHLPRVCSGAGGQQRELFNSCAAARICVQVHCGCLEQSASLYVYGACVHHSDCVQV